MNRWITTLPLDWKNRRLEEITNAIDERIEDVQTRTFGGGYIVVSFLTDNNNLSMPVLKNKTTGEILVVADYEQTDGGDWFITMWRRESND